MKNRELNDFAGADGTGISLKKLVNGLITGVNQSAVLHKVYILNEVPEAFRIGSGQVNVISVIKELLITMASHACDTCISVTAEKFKDIIILNFEDQNNNNGYALSFSLMAIEKHARFVGGDIHIEGVRRKVATVSFSFPGLACMANQACSN